MERDRLYLLTRAVGPLGRSRGMLAGLFAQRVGSLVAASGGALGAPPKTDASGETSTSHFPILPITIPHLPPNVKKKIYIHMQIPPKPF